MKDDLPRVEPLEIDESQDEVKDGGGDDEERQQPAQPDQQVEGLVLLCKGPNVVTQK